MCISKTRMMTMYTLPEFHEDCYESMNNEEKIVYQCFHGVNHDLSKYFTDPSVNVDIYQYMCKHGKMYIFDVQIKPITN